MIPLSRASDKPIILLALILSISGVATLTAGLDSPVALAPFATQATSPSWNPATSCDAVVLTLEQYVGAVANPAQKQPNVGADYSGGALILEGAKPAGTNPQSTSWPYSKRSTSPPCTVTLSNGTVLPTLVEIHGVKVGALSDDECGTVFRNQCDQTFNACNANLAPNCSSSYPDTMHKFHSEIDMYWSNSGIAPPRPTVGTIVDLQGFAYWDDAHVSDSWHSFSGWELHPLTAWRLSQSSSSPDFSMVATPSTVKLTAGSSGSSSITASPLNGFKGTVTLVSSSSAGGVSCSLNPTSVVLGGSQNSTLSCSGGSGAYSVVVTGSSGSLSHSTTVTFAFPDFKISASPASINTSPGRTGVSKVIFTSMNGFAGTISLTLSSSNGFNASLNPTSVILGSGGTVNSTLTVSSRTIGSYTANVTGTSGSLTHSISIPVIVSDFSISASPNTLTLAASSTTSSLITLTSLNSFSGTLTLSVTVSPSGPKTSLIPTTITLASNNSGTSTLTIRALNKTPIGSYTVTITATSGSLSHTITIPVTVTA